MIGVMDRGAPWVVLVEDDPDVAQMYQLGLEFHGFTVTIAGSGDEFFGALDGKAPDIIVLDYQLPVHNGAEVLDRIRSDDRIRNVRVFMLSNFPPTHEGAIDRVFQQGAVAWLEKSKTTPALLAEKLAEVLLVRPTPGKVFKV